MILPDEERPIRCVAGVAWAAFEMPKSGPRYRAGIEFFDAESGNLDRFIEQNKLSWNPYLRLCKPPFDDRSGFENRLRSIRSRRDDRAVNAGHLFEATNVASRLLGKSSKRVTPRVGVDHPGMRS